MADNNSSGLGAGVAIGVGLGILIGGFFAFLILHAQKTTTEAQTLQQAIPQVPVYQPAVSCPLPQIIIREVPPHPVIQSITPVLPVERSAQVQVQTMEPGAIYKNNEAWVIERGSDGRIKKMKVIRDARATKA